MRSVALFTLLLDILFPPRASEKIVRTLKLSDSARHLLPTFFETPHKEKIISLLPYHEEGVRALILETKYHGNAKATALLGELLSEFLTEYLEEESALAPTRFILVPIPLSQKRRRDRGYNQSEEICKMALRFAPHFSVQPELLVRTRDTVPQTSLDASKRRSNMQGAFEAKPLDSTYTYIVVDDVVTTGTTLLEAMRALQKAGTKNVSGLALAH